MMTSIAKVLLLDAAVNGICLLEENGEVDLGRVPAGKVRAEGDLVVCEVDGEEWVLELKRR